MHFLVSSLLIAIVTILIAYLLSKYLLDPAPDNCKAWNSPYKMEIITFISILLALLSLNYFKQSSESDYVEYEDFNDLYNSKAFSN
jgi:uncharacterized membrane protein YwzB